MKKFLCLIILSLGSRLTVAQVFGTQYREQFTYVTALSYPMDGKNRVLAIGAKPGFWFISRIFIYDNSLILNDSIELLKGTIPQRNEPLKINNRLYWPVIYYDTLNNSGGKFSILELDTTYHHVALHKLNNYNNMSILTNVNVTHILNRFYVCYLSELGATTSVIYKLDHQFMVLDSVKYTGSINDMHRVNNSLMISGPMSPICSGPNATTMKMTIVDTNLVAQSCYSFDSLGTHITNPNSISQKIPIRPISGSCKTIPISSTKTFAAGSTSLRYQYFMPVKEGIINAILNNNNQVVNVAVFGNSVTNTNYFENSNFAAVKNNWIVTVGCDGNDFQFPGLVQPQKTKIFINKLDTMGNNVWSKLKGGDMFYRPASIIFSSDGGCLIAGFRYDSTTMKAKDQFNQIRYESFLLKLDSNGEYVADVGIAENGQIINGIKCFPNPTHNQIHFDIPFQEHIEITIYSTLGSDVLEIKNYNNLSAIDVSRLENGVYYYKVQTKSKNYSGKFIKA